MIDREVLVTGYAAAGGSLDSFLFFFVVVGIVTKQQQSSSRLRRMALCQVDFWIVDGVSYSTKESKFNCFFFLRSIQPNPKPKLVFMLRSPNGPQK